MEFRDGLIMAEKVPGINLIRSNEEAINKIEQLLNAIPKPEGCGCKQRQQQLLDWLRR